MKKGLIVINAYYRAASCLNQSERLKQELGALGVEADIRPNNDFPAIISDGGELETRVKDYDFCVYLDKDKYLSLMLEEAGLRLFNRHAAIEACDDKMTTGILLAGQGIPMPKTLPGLLCYDQRERVPDELIARIGEELGYPLVMKMSYGSMGKGVFKIESGEALRAKLEELKCTPHLFQRWVGSSCGRDIRVIVIGHRYFAAMIRQSEGDFRSNLELGGRGIATTPPQEVIDLCERASVLLGLDYCGVDVLFGEEEGKYYLCEVNSNAFFGGIERATQKNVAKRYAEHIYDVIYRRS